MTDAHLDGNVLAGPLSSVFTADVTSATAVCAGCGRSDRLAAAAVYGAPMGYIARCPGCDQVLLRYAEAPTGATLDMRGIATLRLTTG
ncbi:DUF6510 family protein [Amycolatopsis sp. MEPSY49]|uniref:DUF6510 family protein n=1 Tax=Amycolatopsis sp. MEPSY49 TaxID=3151600 RepID=UPI003EF11D3F